jgi:hypothetical protein
MAMSVGISPEENPNMQNMDNELKQESQPPAQPDLKRPSESRFNDAEYKRWWDQLQAIRFPNIEQG